MPGSLPGPMVIAVRTGASALNVQYWQPLLAFSEYTMLLALPTKMRPPTTVGCANDAIHALERERPFQLQPWDIAGGQLRHRGRLKAMLREIRAPAVPIRLVKRIDERGRLVR